MSFIQLRIPDMIHVHLSKLDSWRLNLIQYEKCLYQFCKTRSKTFYCFFNFWVEKTALKSIRLPAKFESDWSKTKGDIAPHMRSHGILRTRFVWWWGEGGRFVPPPLLQTFVKFRGFLEQYIRSVLTYHFKPW